MAEPPTVGVYLELSVDPPVLLVELPGETQLGGITLGLEAGKAEGQQVLNRRG